MYFTIGLKSWARASLYGLRPSYLLIYTPELEQRIDLPGK